MADTPKRSNNKVEVASKEFPRESSEQDRYDDDDALSNEEKFRQMVEDAMQMDHVQEAVESDLMRVFGTQSDHDIRFLLSENPKLVYKILKLEDEAEKLPEHMAICRIRMLQSEMDRLVGKVYKLEATYLAHWMNNRQERKIDSELEKELERLRGACEILDTVDNLFLYGLPIPVGYSDSTGSADGIIGEELSHGVPTPYSVRRYNGYTVGYDQTRKNPLWVIYALNNDMFSNRVKSGKSHKSFKEDPVLNTPSRKQSYAPYDKGHMKPAGDSTSHAKAWSDTYYLSNICPQHPNLNKKGWKKLEETVREWAKEHEKLWICTGPLWCPNDGKLNFEVIGRRTDVPTHFYKAVILKDQEGKVKLRCFKMINEEVVIRDETVLKDNYSVLLEDIERDAGFRIFPLLKKEEIYCVNWSSDSSCEQPINDVCTETDKAF